jgi:hypothetical protein
MGDSVMWVSGSLPGLREHGGRVGFVFDLQAAFSVIQRFCSLWLLLFHFRLDSKLRFLLWVGKGECWRSEGES